jgi:hypothetical protein
LAKRATRLPHRTAGLFELRLRRQPGLLGALHEDQRTGAGDGGRSEGSRGVQAKRQHRAGEKEGAQFHG